MSTFRDQLQSIADGAPAVDLAERVIRRAERRRRGARAAAGAVVLAVAVAVVAAGGAIVTGGQRGGVITSGVITSKVTDTLPASGVGPLSHAYYDWCGEEWTPGRNTHTFARECAQWNVVTRAGRTYRMPEALSVYTEQSADEYMNTNAPLVISADGERVAYYSEKDQAFAVRDLHGGQVWTVPVPVSRAELVARPVLLLLSPGGTRLGLWGGSGLDVVVEVETGHVTHLPDGWHVRAVGDAGGPVIVTREGRDDELGALREDGTVRAFPPLEDTPPPDLGQPSPDGRTLAYLTGMTGAATSTPGPSERSTANATIVTLDAATGETLRRTRLRGAPRDFGAMRVGGWLSRTEVVVTEPVMDRVPKRGETPTLGERTYRVDVRTGRVRPLAVHTFRGWAGSLELPGF
ncbi:hypothetical protein HNP84_008968 [Thermocatellispora tengchongensis]|uniref:Uncharacterized protein n=1 Tax=Thermocatellispora tengchongensis TaxID=1073253 RepID=A0A840PTE6_9ACTN|nr:hypothetical protein [Thermocatellispora tengchongensis]MBB5139205.1 hypothetical protein [Thermocatellispora tengchongensis]